MSVSNFAMNSAIMDQIGQLMSTTNTLLSNNSLELIKLAALALRYTGTRDESNREYHEFLHKVDNLLELIQSKPDDESLTPQIKESEICKTQNSIRYGGFYLDLVTFNTYLETNTDNSMTVLHLAVRGCKCAEDAEAAYKETINGVVKFILQKTDILNARNCDGQTALMMAAENGCLHIVRVLVDWSNEHDCLTEREDEYDGVNIDINAEDIYGETALFKAALRSRVEVVKFLVQRGALDIHDNRGFSALHAAVCGPQDFVYHTLVSEFFGDFCWLAFIEHSSNLSAETCIAYAQCLKQLEPKTRNYGKTVELIDLLLQNHKGRITVKDFRDKTALDLAIRSTSRISELTVNKLNKRTHTEKQTNPEELLGIDELRRTSFHRLVATLNIHDLRLSDFLTAVIQMASKIKKIDFQPFKTMISKKDSRGRTVLHYAAKTRSFLHEQSVTIIETIVKLGCTVNETDVYGRTPLHYATDEALYELLLKEPGVDETIKDIDGKTPLDLRKLRQKEKSDSEKNQEKLTLDDVNNFDQIWTIWTTGKFAFREPIYECLIESMKCFFERLAEGIGKKDPRFECRPVMVGSAYEGTRIGFMNEFDFDLVLTKFSECCDVSPAPEAPTGFVRLQRKLNLTGDGASEKRSQNELNFDEFFNNNGVLLSNKVASRFRCLYSEVLKQPCFWESEPYFEWSLQSEFDAVRICYRDGDNPVRYKNLTDLRASTTLCTTISLTLNRPINGQYMFTGISVDIVPCVRVAGWWPDGILSSVPNDLRAEGCYLVFEQPQKKYPWVPYSTDPYVRISFAEAESKIIKESLVLAKAAYMVVKKMLSNGSLFTNVWKNSLLYCIEAMNNERNNNMNYEEISREDMRLFLKKLSLCFFEFYRQDFCPCYIMPSFSLPIGSELKSHHRDDLWRYKNEEFYQLYRCLCEGVPEIPYREPVSQPLVETFDRDELMRKISKIRTSENIVAQPSESSEPTQKRKITITLELLESTRQDREPSIVREEDGATILYSRENS